MSTPPDDRLRRLLGGDHLAPLRKRLRRRFERAEPGQLHEGFRIAQITTEEHAVLASLIGRSPRFSGSLWIDLPEVDAVLARAGIAASLRDALEQLDGPIINLAAARGLMLTRWSEMVDGVEDPGLKSFLRSPAAVGLLKRLSGGSPDAAADLCRRVEAVLRRLPASGVTRSQLAAEVLGDAHALDDNRPVATLVLAVWRRVVAPTSEAADGLPAESPNQDVIRAESPDERARDIWSRAGILVNELARPALFLNLPMADAESRAGKPGEPGYVSLRELLRSPPAWAVAGRTVYVCENANFLAIAADRFGQHCAPMVCTDGMPSATPLRLLNQLAQAGARLRYHGDFDWPGLRIGNYIMREYGARPWRFGAVDYIAAVKATPRPGRPLTGVAAAASWDAELAPTMEQYHMAIHEEGISASLLQDLGGSSI
jgi:uncharacterized protein (TIGR02679 family)